jgi:hypothetical protein
MMRMIFSRLSARRLFAAATVLLTVSSPAFRAGAQQLPAAAATTAATVSAPAAGTPSTLLQPALSTLRDALGTLRLEKWKAPGGVRQKTDANVTSIQHDLDATLPGLLTKADAAPDSLSQMLPLLRNVDALYDVVLRVANTAELAAPAPQSAALNDALSGLESARRSVGERLQTVAAAQDKQVQDLQSALRASAQPPAPPACPAPATPKTGTAASRAAAKKKAAAKKVPATGSAAGSGQKQ